MNFEFILSVVLITIAGLSTLIGSYIIMKSKNKSHKKLGFLLGFASGIMICIVIKELLPEAKELLSASYSFPSSSIILVLSLLFGFALSVLLDKLIHHHNEEESQDEHCHMCDLGLTAAITLALHKIPEGIAIFMAIHDSFVVAVPLSLAIAIHHIPEGMIISAPIYYATGNKKKALMYSLASGLVLPVFGLLGFVFLTPFLNNAVEGIMLAVTASIMFYITFKEIMPNAFKYGRRKTTVFSTILGIIFIYLLEML